MNDVSHTSRPEMEDDARLDEILAELAPPPPTAALRERVLGIGAVAPSQPVILARWALARAEIRWSALPLRWAAAAAVAVVAVAIGLQLAPSSDSHGPAPVTAVAAMDAEPEAGLLGDVPIVDAADGETMEYSDDAEIGGLAEAGEVDGGEEPFLMLSSLSGLALE